MFNIEANTRAQQPSVDTMTREEIRRHIEGMANALVRDTQDEIKKLRSEIEIAALHTEVEILRAGRDAGNVVSIFRGRGRNAA